MHALRPTNSASRPVGFDVWSNGEAIFRDGLGAVLVGDIAGERERYLMPIVG